MNPFRLCLLAPLSLLSCTPAAPAPDVVGFPSEVIEAHRISGSTLVPTAAASVGFLGNVRLRITIDTSGTVRDVQVEKSDFNSDDAAPAIAAARQWKFRPFEYRGHPVAATASIDVDYRAKPVWADPKASFPAIDYANLRIELIRSACLGSCPIYKVSITGDGTVTYTPVIRPSEEPGADAGAPEDHYVLVGGTHRTRIDRAALDGLLEKFSAARFFGLKKEYSGAGTDGPTYELHFASAGRSHAVVDYTGHLAGMPEEVTALEDEVDRVAGAARWVKGDATTVPALVAEGFDPRAPAAADLARRAVASGGEAVVLDLLAAGMPLDQAVKAKDAAGARPLGLALLADALGAGRPKVALALIRRGWLAKMPPAERAVLFARGAGGCDPAIVRAMVAMGVDPNVQAPSRPGYHDTGGAALHAALDRYSSCEGLKDRVSLVRALLDAGADPNLADASGATSVFTIQDPELLDLLLARGARVRVQDKRGISPVFASWPDVIVRMLLDAGAEPRGRYNGRTLPMIARQDDMPATAAWLAAHGIR